MTPFRSRRRGASVALALTLAGCGAGRSDPPGPQAALPTVVATAITPAGITLSPDRLGAGPVKLVITNQTGASQQLAVQSAGTGSSFHQETAPINPQDMAQLRARLRPGSYTVTVRTPGLKSAKLAVEPSPTGSR